MISSNLKVMNDFIKFKVIIDYIKFEFVKSSGVMLISFSQLALPAEGIKKDPTAWLNGARPHL
jgi:hypothetical protein